MGSEQSYQNNRGTNQMFQGINHRGQAIPFNTTCPSCGKLFQAGSPMFKFQVHINECLQRGIANPQRNANVQPVQNFKEAVQVDEKVPVNEQRTKFVWKKVPINKQAVNINLSAEQVKKLPFQQKNKWFRANLEKMRISWDQGADFMNINKQNLLITSYIESRKVNMHKQVKIKFVNDSVQDAGGLLRQWIHMIIKEIFDYSTGLFAICNTDDIMYKLKWDNELDQQFTKQLLILFGIILGKSIFEKIPILCYLDKTILRQLCSSRPKLSDIYGYDKGLYQSWKYMEENLVQGMDATFTIFKEKENGTIQQLQLIEFGSQIEVNQANKSMYIQTCIQFYCEKAVSRSINFIKEGLYKIIPDKFLQVFEPFEMEMLINGVPFIDPEDWKNNTIYRGVYHNTHKNIQWFWKLVSQFDQQQLGRLLHYCTGSSRPPIQGFQQFLDNFSKLQSNRGVVSLFMIQSTKLDKINPYPKGHTCFNRLELPLYPSEQSLKIHVLAIVNNDLEGVFGLD